MEVNVNIDKGYMKLSPDLRAKYAYETIKEIVFKNRDGVNVTQLDAVLPFSRKVIEKHLEKLVSLNECYSKTYGMAVVYFPNSRAIHSVVDSEFSIGNKIFRD